MILSLALARTHDHRQDRTCVRAHTKRSGPLTARNQWNSRACFQRKLKHIGNLSHVYNMSRQARVHAWQRLRRPEPLRFGYLWRKRTAAGSPMDEAQKKSRGLATYYNKQTGSRKTDCTSFHKIQVVCMVNKLPNTLVLLYVLTP